MVVFPMVTTMAMAMAMAMAVAMAMNLENRRQATEQCQHRWRCQARGTRNKAQCHNGTDKLVNSPPGKNQKQKC